MVWASLPLQAGWSDINSSSRYGTLGGMIFLKGIVSNSVFPTGLIAVVPGDISTKPYAEQFACTARVTGATPVNQVLFVQVQGPDVSLVSNLADFPGATAIESLWLDGINFES